MCFTKSIHTNVDSSQFINEFACMLCVSTCIGIRTSFTAHIRIRRLTWFCFCLLHDYYFFRLLVSWFAVAKKRRKNNREKLLFKHCTSCELNTQSFLNRKGKVSFQLRLHSKMKMTIEFWFMIWIWKVAGKNGRENGMQIGYDTRNLVWVITIAQKYWNVYHNWNEHDVSWISGFFVFGFDD